MTTGVGAVCGKLLLVQHTCAVDMYLRVMRALARLSRTTQSDEDLLSIVDACVEEKKDTSLQRRMAVKGACACNTVTVRAPQTCWYVNARGRLT